MRRTRRAKITKRFKRTERTRRTKIDRKTGGGGLGKHRDLEN